MQGYQGTGKTVRIELFVEDPYHKGSEMPST